MIIVIDNKSSDNNNNYNNNNNNHFIITVKYISNVKKITYIFHRFFIGIKSQMNRFGFPLLDGPMNIVFFVSNYPSI